MRHYFVLFFLFSGQVLAQQLQFENMSALPLPSQECYNVIQDSKGYIWFSSEAGLCRYNGSDLEVFDKRNGLPEGSTYAITEDRDGLLWIATSKNRILNYSDGELKEAAFSKSYEAQLRGSLELTYLFRFNAQGALHINASGRSFVWDSGKLKETFNPDTSVHFYLVKDKDGLIPFNGRKEIQDIYRTAKTASQGCVKILIKDNDKVFEINSPFDKDDYPYWRVLTAHTTTADFFSFENVIYRVAPDNSYQWYGFPDRIQQLYVDKEGGLWVGVRKNGLFYYPDVMNMERRITALQEYSVTGISVDNENGVWCSTLEKGMFYCRNKEIISYANNKGLDKKAELLKKEGGLILAAAGDNELFVMGENVPERKRFDGRPLFTVSDVLKIERGWLIASKADFFETGDDLRPKSDIKIAHTNFNAGVYSLAELPDGRVLTLQPSVVSEVVGNKIIKRTSGHFPSAAKLLLYPGGDQLLVGCKTGLFGVDIHTYEIKKVNGLEGEVTGFIKNRKGEVWISTKNDGLYKMNNGVLENITREYQLNNVRLFGLAEDKDGRIWLGSNIGLVLIREGSATTVYDQLNGLSSNEVNKVAADDDRLFFSTNEGVSSFRLNANIGNTVSPAIYLDSLKVNGKTLASSGGFIQLQPDENSLSLAFDLLTYKGNKVRMHYLLVSEDTVEGETEGNLLPLNNLDPGMYGLTVHAMNNDRVMSARPVILRFEILKPFWQTAWFVTLCVVLAGVLMYLFVVGIIKRIRVNEQEKTRINKLLAEYHLSALQAQMNPHFIFNAINSIQGYILKKNEQQAYDYLAKFSKLIRMVLNHSREKSLPLKQELEMLALYVELEQLRFEKSFDFELNVDPEINQFDTMIPGMLIQPYVENAIWHGLMNLENKKGKLSLDISQDENLLRIVIMDNGVGRDLAKTFKKEQSHNPIAMKLTEQRLSVINALNEFQNANVTVTDLHDEKGEPSGTKVEILIPVSDGK